jgi:hypothetical protein
MDRIVLAQDRDQQKVLMNVAINFRVPKNAGKLPSAYKLVASRVVSS